jgi:Acetyltransferase (isoleucine patch superfamily)
MSSSKLKNKLYSLLHPLYYRIQKQWRERNPHNFTKVNVASNNIKNISVGNGTYGEITAFNDSFDKKLIIGNYCSLALNVTFLVARDHKLVTASSFPFKQIYRLENDNYYDAVSKGNIVVSDDVWIGYGATILSGVSIGQGAVIAAGAVVTSDVPPYAIAGGVPARVINYRFQQSVIDFMLSCDYSKLTQELIKEHIEVLYQSIDGMDVDDVKRLYDWFPKREYSIGISPDSRGGLQVIVDSRFIVREKKQSQSIIELLLFVSEMIYPPNIYRRWVIVFGELNTVESVPIV